MNTEIIHLHSHGHVSWATVFLVSFVATVSSTASSSNVCFWKIFVDDAVAPHGRRVRDNSEPLVFRHGAGQGGIVGAHNQPHKGLLTSVLVTSV